MYVLWEEVLYAGCHVTMPVCYRWGYFALGCFWMVVVLWGLFVTGEPLSLSAAEPALGQVT